MAALDEAWALGYFQAVVSILLFGVGIPSLVLQTIVPDDLRRIAHRHFLTLRWGFWLVAAFMAVALVFVWILHPTQGSDVRLLPGVDVDQWLAASLMTAAIVGVGGVWFLYRSHRRDRIVLHLQRRCVKRIKQKGAPDETTLDDLQYLGEQAATRAEKRQVLDALQTMATEVQRYKDYRGNRLEGIIRAIQSSLQKGVDRYSLSDGIVVLARISDNMQATSTQSSRDARLLLEALESLVRVAWTVDGDRAALLILEAVGSMAQAPDGLEFEAEIALENLGVSALANRRYLTAVDVLTRLEAGIRSTPTADPDESTAYLGLVAHFRGRGGVARARAMSGFAQIIFTPSTVECLRAAFAFHYNTCQFETANLLSRWIDEGGGPDPAGPSGSRPRTRKR
jgi:hypothetical protein